jgi:hypothetical protein
VAGFSILKHTLSTLALAQAVRLTIKRIKIHKFFIADSLCGHRFDIEKRKDMLVY